jgi:hypothetical protein
MEPGSPIACRLTAPDLQARLIEIRSGLLSIVDLVEAIDQGYRLHLPNTEDTAGAVLDFVRFERQCCPFLDYGVRLPGSGTTPIHIELTGPKDVQEFIRVTFIANVRAGFATS